MTSPMGGACGSCTPWCHHCQQLCADPSGCCYCECCSAGSCWWRCCLGRSYYQPTHCHTPNNAIYVPTTGPVLNIHKNGSRYEDFTNDGDDIAVFTRAPSAQRYGTTNTSTEGGSYNQQEVVRVSAIGGTHTKVETPGVRYDHIVISQPTTGGGTNSERAPFLPS